MARIAALVTAAGLLFAGTLHVVWGLDVSTWPFADKAALGAAVMNLPPDALPPEWTTIGLGLLLCASGAVVLGRTGVWGRLVPRWVFTVGAWIVAGVLLLRGASGLLAWGLFVTSIPTPYARWNAAVFSPSALILGLLCFFVALSPPVRSRRRRRSQDRRTRRTSTTVH
jgi:hypothetical protein